MENLDYKDAFESLCELLNVSEQEDFRVRWALAAYEIGALQAKAQNWEELAHVVSSSTNN